MNRRLVMFAIAAAVPVAGLFCVAGFAFGDFGRAFDVLVGRQPPWGDSAWIAVPLSVAGYLFAPAVIGVAVSATLGWAVSRRVTTLDEAVEDLQRRLLEPGPTA